VLEERFRLWMHVGQPQWIQLWLTVFFLWVRLFRQAIKISNGGSKPRILPKYGVQWAVSTVRAIGHKSLAKSETVVNYATLLRNIEEDLEQNVADEACLSVRAFVSLWALCWPVKSVVERNGLSLDRRMLSIDRVVDY
jgi:hypothetical protein